MAEKQSTTLLHALLWAGLIGITLAVYWQVYAFDFVDFDDMRYVADNLHVQRGLTLDNAIWAFTTDAVGNWHPLTWLSYMLDYELFGLNAGRYHVVNVLLHVLGVLLLFEALRRIAHAHGNATGILWRSTFVAAVFAVHPLHVESVAWIAERKDVLSTCFWFLTMIAYCAYARQPKLWRYLVVAGVFALGLMAKPMLVTLPCVLLLLDYWPLDRTRAANENEEGTFPVWKLVLEKAPLFALSVASSAITLLVQTRGGAVHSLTDLTVPARVANALVAYVAYIGKALWPTGLAVLYPHSGSGLGLWRPAGAALLLVGASVLFLILLRRRRYLAVGWLWYLGTLAPVIGIIQVGAQAMADRYTYVPLIGLSIIVAWGMPDLLGAWRLPRAVTIGAAGVVVAAMTVTSAFQVRYWRDSKTLFTHTLEVTTDNYVAHHSLGLALFREDNLPEAIRHFSEALRVNPTFAPAHVNLGNAFAKQGRSDVAMAHFRAVLSLPASEVHPNAHNGLGLELAKLGKLDAAVAQYKKALEQDPEMTLAHALLGNALVSMQRFDEAIAHFAEAIKLGAQDGVAEYGWGRALAQRGKSSEAVARFRASLRKNPGDAEAHFSLGFELAKLGRADEAAAAYRAAIQRDPALTAAYKNLGNILARQGKPDEAIALYAKVLEIDPADPRAHYNIGKVLEVQGKQDEASAFYRKAMKNNAADPDPPNNLAGILFAQGRYDEAAGYYEQALEIDPNYLKAHINLASVKAALGRLDEAKAHLRKALEIDPGDALARQRLEKLNAEPAAPEQPGDG